MQGQSDRLPVNPRRQHVAPGERKRVAKACNACNIRRAKCSGGQPCERCRKSSRDCVYPAAEETVTINRRSHQHLLQRVADLEERLRAAEGANASDNGAAGSVNVGAQAKGSRSSAESDLLEHHDNLQQGRILQDPDGSVRYFGESSGATFINHLREYFATVISLTSGSRPGETADGDDNFLHLLGFYQTHDSRPLNIPSFDPPTIPTKDEALVMLSELRYWTQDGAATVESGGLHYWLDSDALLRNHHQDHADTSSEAENGHDSLSNAAFAVACVLNPSCTPPWAIPELFFSRARKSLGNPLHASSGNNAAALALLGFYLLNSNRRDAAYTYVSNAMHVLISKGSHRGWMVDEASKRLFWTVYNLDRLLSMLLGRPPVLPEESIKIDLPREVRGVPFPFGLTAHIGLSRISGYIVSNIFDVARRPVEPQNVVSHITSALSMLRSWREQDLPDLLQYVEGSFSQDRAVYELQMAHNQLLILAMRPLLFDALKRAIPGFRFYKTSDYGLLSEGVSLDECAYAARQSLEMSRHILDLRDPTILSHMMIHYIFNAALTLQLQQLISPGTGTAYQQLVHGSITTLEKARGSNRSLATDCSRILSELARVIQRLVGSVTPSQAAFSPPAATEANPRSEHETKAGWRYGQRQ